MNINIRKSIFLLAIPISCALNVSGQNSALPIDAKLKTGTLANGFSYYIRQNAEPKNRVTIYLVNKVGSILENDEEQGLAHFMEHMNFNGTIHFPKNELVTYLQKSGIKFGGDLNAFTGFDQTVYQLPLPTDDPALLQNGFQIMRDWAHDALLDSVEINSERGVILEEKRLRANAQQRMQQGYFPVLFNNTIYAKRIPIGTEEVLKGFNRNTLVNFYRKWYRPNLQALIVVGDIDVTKTEKTIIQLFSDLKNPANAPALPPSEIKLLNKNQYFIGVDKEINLPSIQIFSKFIASTTKTKEDYAVSIKRELLNTILAERFADLSKQSNTGFVFAKSGINTILNNLSAFTTTFAARAENIEKAFKTVWTEVERCKKYGITEAELERAKLSYLNKLESSYNERDKTPSVNFVNEYMRNFTTGEAIPGIEYEYTMCKDILNTINTASINEAIATYITETNRDILVVGPENDKNSLPSESQIDNWINEIRHSAITDIKNDNVSKALLAEKPQKGKIVKESYNQKLNITELRLNNGVKVVIKPTTFKNDEIRINASSQGGTSLYNDKDFESAAHAAECATAGGVGDFSQAQLQKFLSGKKIVVMPYVSERFEGLNGISAPSTIETAFQLIYLYFTKPRKDVQVYKNELERMNISLATRGNEPNNVFSDSVIAVMNNYNFRRMTPTVKRMAEINPERSFEIYKERFADASDFTFTFVGNINIDSIKPLIEQYIGSLPCKNSKEKAHDMDIHIPYGKINKAVYKGIEKKSMVKIVYSGNYNYSKTENRNIEALADLMTIKLLQRLREKESGVYGISATAQLYKYPNPHYTITIGFGCAPDNVEKLIHSAEEVVGQLKSELPLKEDVEKVVNEDLRDIEVKMGTNSFWMNHLVSSNQMNEDVETILSYSKLVKDIKPETLKKAANNYLSGDNLAKLILYPNK